MAVNPERQPGEPWVPTESFGDRLVLVRRHVGNISTEEAAARAGLKAPTWNTWENGASPRNMAEVVAKIHDAFGVDRDWLMWGSQAGAASLQLLLTLTFVVSLATRYPALAAALTPIILDYEAETPDGDNGDSVDDEHTERRRNFGPVGDQRLPLQYEQQQQRPSVITVRPNRSVRAITVRAQGGEQCPSDGRARRFKSNGTDSTASPSTIRGLRRLPSLSTISAKASP